MLDRSREAEVSAQRTLKAFNITMELAGSPGYLALPPTVLGELEAVTPSPVFSMMAVIPPGIDVPFDGATITGSHELQWVSRDSSKPGIVCMRKRNPARGLPFCYRRGWLVGASMLCVGPRLII